jgi:hypothetical protein
VKLTIELDLTNAEHRDILLQLMGQPAPKAEEPNPAPKAEEPAPAPKAAPEVEMNADMLRAIVVEAHKKLGKPEANAIVKKYGAGISKIDPADLQSCADELKAAMENA